jgi:hypothetical protein
MALRDSLLMSVPLRKTFPAAGLADQPERLAALDDQ